MKVKTRAIGVSNYSLKEMNEILESADVVPALNQVEFHPFLYNEKMLSFCKYNKIQLEAYSPLTRGEETLSSRYSESSKEIWQNSSTGVDTLELATRDCSDSKIYT